MRDLLYAMYSVFLDMVSVANTEENDKKKAYVCGSRLGERPFLGQ